MHSDFDAADFWKALVLFGLNQATYKIALGKTLLELSQAGYTKVPWDELSRGFFDQYSARLAAEDAMPQQSNPNRRTKMEQIVARHKLGRLSESAAIEEVGQTAFGDVIHRFPNLGKQHTLGGKFYSVDFSKNIILTDALHDLAGSKRRELDEELNARWGLLEGAFSIQQQNFSLVNDLRLVYLSNAQSRKPLTPNIPFLQGYQGNVCFYCGEVLHREDVHVDHVLPWQVIRHDEAWNLVLAHGFCNLQKSDRLVGPQFMETNRSEREHHGEQPSLEGQNQNRTRADASREGPQA